MNKKAFLINSLGSGGAEKVVQILANNFSKQDEVHLILLAKNDFYPIDPNVKIKYLTTFNDSIHPIIKIIILPYLGYLLARYCKENNITKVVSHLYRANYVNVICKFFLRNHIANIVNHGTFSRYKVEGLLGKVNILLIKNLYKRANKIICVSEGMRQEFLGMFNMDVPSVVINNPYEIDNIIDQSKEDITDFIFKQDKFYIITVGRLIKLKRVEIIIETFSELIKNPNYECVELLIVGDGDEKKRLINLSKSLEVNKHIHFLGRESNPFKYIAKSNLMIMASESEGFPNVLIEALACKCPIISSDCDNGPREILAPSSTQDTRLTIGIEIGEHGILFPTGDVSALKLGIETMLKDPLKINSFKELGLERARFFDKEIILKQYDLLV